MLSISAVTLADGIFAGRGVGSDGIAAVNEININAEIFFEPQTTGLHGFAMRRQVNK